MVRSSVAASIVDDFYSRTAERIEACAQENVLRS